jgi:hypothetical protein
MGVMIPRFCIVAPPMGFIDPSLASVLAEAVLFVDRYPAAVRCLINEACTSDDYALQFYGTKLNQITSRGFDPALHSYRSAIIGSTRAALLAGR